MPDIKHFKQSLTESEIAAHRQRAMQKMTKKPLNEGATQEAMHQKEIDGHFTNLTKALEEFQKYQKNSGYGDIEHTSTILSQLRDTHGTFKSNRLGLDKPTVLNEQYTKTDALNSKRLADLAKTQGDMIGYHAHMRDYNAKMMADSFDSGNVESAFNYENDLFTHQEEMAKIFTTKQA